MRRSEQSGLFLVQAMVFVLILSMAASFLLQLTFGRSVVVGRLSLSQGNRFAGRAAESQVLRCLEGSTVGQSGCDATAYAGCFPGSAGGRVIKVSVYGTPPLCRIDITVQEP